MSALRSILFREKKSFVLYVILFSVCK